MTTTRLPTSLITKGSHGQRLKEIFLVSVTASALLLGSLGLARAQSADDTMSQIKVIEGLAPAGSISSDTQKEIDKANQAGTDYFKAKQDLKTAQDDAVTKLGLAVKAQSDVDSAQKAVNDAQAKLDATNKVYSGAASAAVALNKAVTEYNTQKGWLDTATTSLAIANQGQAAFDAALKSTNPDVQKAVAGYKSADFAKFKVDAATGFANAQTKTWAAQYVAQVASDAVKDPKNGLAPLQDANKTLQAAKTTLATNQQVSTAATAAVNNANTVAQTAQNKVDTTGAAATSQATKAFNDANSDMVSFQNKPAAPAKPSAPGNVAVVTPSSGTPIVAPAPIVVTPNAPGAGLISEHGAGVISNDGGSIISHDAGSIISHDAGTIISHDAGSLVSKNSSGVLTDNGMLATGSPGNKIISDNTEGLISEHGAGAIAQSSALLASLPVASAQQVTASNAFKQDSTISGFANITTADQDLKNAVGRLSAQDNKTLSDLKAQVASGKPLTADQANQVAAISNKIAKNMDPANVKSLQASVATKAGTPSAAPNSAPAATAAAKVATTTAAPAAAPNPQAASSPQAQSATSTANKAATSAAPVTVTSNAASSAAPAAAASKAPAQGAPQQSAAAPSASQVTLSPPRAYEAATPATAPPVTHEGYAPPQAYSQLDNLWGIANNQVLGIQTGVQDEKNTYGGNGKLGFDGTEHDLSKQQTNAQGNLTQLNGLFTTIRTDLDPAIAAGKKSVDELTAASTLATSLLHQRTEDLATAVSAYQTAAQAAQSTLAQSAGSRVDEAKLLVKMTPDEVTNAAVQARNKTIADMTTARNDLAKAQTPTDKAAAQTKLNDLTKAANSAADLVTKLQGAQKNANDRLADARGADSIVGDINVKLHNASSDLSAKQQQLTDAVNKVDAASKAIQTATNTVNIQVNKDATRSTDMVNTMKVLSNFDIASDPATLPVDRILASATSGKVREEYDGKLKQAELTPEQVKLAQGVKALNDAKTLSSDDRILLNGLLTGSALQNGLMKMQGQTDSNGKPIDVEAKVIDLTKRIETAANLSQTEVKTLQTTNLDNTLAKSVTAYTDRKDKLTAPSTTPPPFTPSTNQYKSASLTTPAAPTPSMPAAANVPGGTANLATTPKAPDPAVTAAPNLPGSATPTTPATTTANGANPTGGGAPTVTLPNGKVEGLGAIVPSPAELQAQKDMQGLSRQGVQQIVDAGPKVLDGFKQMLASEKDPAKIKGIQGDMDRITAEIKIGTQMLDPDRKSPAAGQPIAAPATPTVTANATSVSAAAAAPAVDLAKPGQGGNIISSGGDKIVGTPAIGNRDNAEVAKLQQGVAKATDALQTIQKEMAAAQAKGDTKTEASLRGQLNTAKAQVDSAKSALVKAETGTSPPRAGQPMEAPKVANAAPTATAAPAATSPAAPATTEQSGAPARLTTDQGKAVHQALSTIPGNLNKSEQKQFDTLSTLVDKATSKGLTTDEATQLKAGLAALADKHPKAEQQHGLNAIGTGITVARKPEQTPAIATREGTKPELGKPIAAPPVMESKGATPPVTDMVKRPEQKGPDVKPDQAIARTTPTTPVSNPATEKKDMIPEHHMPNGTAPVAHANPAPSPSLGGGAGEKKDMIPEHHMNNAGQPPQTPRQAVATPSAPVKPATPPPSAPKPPALAGAGAPKMVTPPPAIKPPTPPPAAPPPGMTKH